MDVLNYNFIRLGLTRAKSLQTATRLPRETHRRSAVPKEEAKKRSPFYGKIFRRWRWVVKKWRVLKGRGTASGIAFPGDCSGECGGYLKWIKKFRSKIYSYWLDHSENTVSTKLQGVSKNR